METSSTLKITPLGGMGEIGLNCQLWETPLGVVMIDCGLMFPSDDLLGIDVLIPNFAAVRAVKDRLSGIVLTHGHEDHIGALPWIVPYLKGVHVYGSRFTLALVRHKLEEHGVLDCVECVVCDEETVLSMAGLQIRFFPVCHSIPEGFALGIESDVGRILHSGDFKIEDAPLSGVGTDLSCLAGFAADGLRLLLADSTNVGREGHSISEREVRDSLRGIFATAEGRIIITLFSSHIQRIQEVLDLAAEHGRTVVLSGRSLVSNVKIAESLGLLSVPAPFYNAFAEVPDLPDRELVCIVTGAQGEPLSALSRMAYGMHRQLTIHKGDVVVMSSRIIPGNTRAIIRMINAIFRLGADVFYSDDMHPIHASGHAHKEELRALLEAVQPELFIPMHGEYQHLVKHVRLAQECGVDAANCILLEDGMSIVLSGEDFDFADSVPAAYTIVDGKGIGDVGAEVLRERKLLGDEGLVICFLIIDEVTGDIVQGPEVLSRGFVYEQYYGHVLEDACCVVLDEIEQCRPDRRVHMEDVIRLALRRFFRSILGRDPVIVPIIREVCTSL